MSSATHSGNHADAKRIAYVMGARPSFSLEELGLPAPDDMLGLDSASHPTQMACVGERIEPVLEREHPDLAIMLGDLSSTRAARLVAVKLGTVNLESRP